MALTTTPRKSAIVTFDEAGAFTVLPTGEEVRFDAIDAPIVSAYWWARKKTTASYAMTNTRSLDGTRISIYMHRLIMNAPKGVNVDHRDGNSLNNCRANLRFATFEENNRNARSRMNTTSRFKGVWYRKDSSRWRACIQVSGTPIALGCFRVEEDAAKAYDDAARKYFREFAVLNFPNEGEQSSTRLQDRKNADRDQTTRFTNTSKG